MCFLITAGCFHKIGCIIKKKPTQLSVFFLLIQPIFFKLRYKHYNVIIIQVEYSAINNERFSNKPFSNNILIPNQYIKFKLRVIILFRVTTDIERLSRQRIFSNLVIFNLLFGLRGPQKKLKIENLHDFQYLLLLSKRKTKICIQSKIYYHQLK